MGIKSIIVDLACQIPLQVTDSKDITNLGTILAT
jgi:hypothetical protein